MWNVVFPAVLSAVLWLAAVVLMLVVLPCFKKLPHLLVGVMQISLSDIEEHDDCTCVKVDRHKIKKWALKALAVLVVPLTLATIFFSFWNVWLVEEDPSGVCLPHFDCFPVFNGKVLQSTPIESCSQSFNISIDHLNSTASLSNDTLTSEEPFETLSKDEVSYKCYRFVFRYAEGIGAAGGILFFTAVFSKLYFSLLGCIITTEDHDYLRCGALIFTWVLAVVLWVVFVIVNAATPIIREAVFKTDTDIVQFFLYTVNFLAVVIGGYIVSFGLIQAEW